MKEICICSAVLTRDDDIIRGHRHEDCLSRIWKTKKKQKKTNNGSQQGFVTSKNRYVNRIEGLELQKLAGIISADTKNGYSVNEDAKILFSEDLY